MIEVPLLWMPVIAAGAVAALGVVVYFIATRDRRSVTQRQASDTQNSKAGANHRATP